MDGGVSVEVTLTGILASSPARMSLVLSAVGEGSVCAGSVSVRDDLSSSL